MAGYADDVKLFGKWSYEGLNLNDISLEDYIAVKAKDVVYLPHTGAFGFPDDLSRASKPRSIDCSAPDAVKLAASSLPPRSLFRACRFVLAAGRYQVKRFRKALCPIVERLCNSLMRKGRNNGKKLLAVRIVQQAFEIIHLLTDENPLQVFVSAVVNAGPREDSTRVGAGGIVRRQAVDVAPFRRVNQALYLMGMGAREASFRTIKTIAECLADEIVNAAKGSSNSYAIKKKDEIERVAKANR